MGAPLLETSVGLFELRSTSAFKGTIKIANSDNIVLSYFICFKVWLYDIYMKSVLLFSLP